MGMSPRVHPRAEVSHTCTDSQPYTQSQGGFEASLKETALALPGPFRSPEKKKEKKPFSPISVN